MLSLSEHIVAIFTRILTSLSFASPTLEKEVQWHKLDREEKQGEDHPYIKRTILPKAWAQGTCLQAASHRP